MRIQHSIDRVFGRQHANKPTNKLSGPPVASPARRERMRTRSRQVNWRRRRQGEFRRDTSVQHVLSVFSGIPPSDMCCLFSRSLLLHSARSLRSSSATATLLDPSGRPPSAVVVSQRPANNDVMMAMTPSMPLGRLGSADGRRARRTRSLETQNWDRLSRRAFAVLRTE